MFSRQMKESTLAVGQAGGFPMLLHDPRLHIQAHVRSACHVIPPGKVKGAGVPTRTLFGAGLQPDGAPSAQRSGMPETSAYIVTCVSSLFLQI